MLRKIILFLENKIPCKLFFFLLEIVSKCKICLDGYVYPIYGVAPQDKKDYPDNYVDDGCGIFYCEDKKL